MNLAGIDLNLLLVFDAVMKERHVTRAGARIGMSQPAMSNALNRLRHHLKDDLFVRGAEGMRPTVRALELAGPINAALQDLSSALEPAAFDPSTAQWQFAIGTNDYCVSTLMPHVITRIQNEAPGVNVRLVASAGQTFDMLDTQTIDFGISSFGDVPDRFGSHLLFEDSYVVLMRKDHPLTQGKVTLERFLDARHLLVSPDGDTEGFVDVALRASGHKRQIAMVVNSFSSAPAMLTHSDLILTVPRRIAQSFGPLYNLVTRPSLFQGPHAFSTVTLVWHSRLASHPAFVWMRELLKETAKTI